MLALLVFPESEESSGSSSSSSSEDESASSSSDEKNKNKKGAKIEHKTKGKATNANPSKKPEQTNLDLLLSLEEAGPTMSSPQSVMSPTMGGLLTPMGNQPLPGNF